MLSLDSILEGKDLTFELHIQRPFKLLMDLPALEAFIGGINSWLNITPNYINSPRLCNFVNILNSLNRFILVFGYAFYIHL